jgi:acyl-CoA synthetase (AMP-forming)/AMP-acid ligase II
MAVWLQIIGKRKLESLEKEKEKIIKIINTINLDSAFLSQSKYNPENWNVRKTEENEYFEYNFVPKIISNSIRIIFNNSDFLEFSGPFDFFSGWYLLGDKYPKEIAEGWQKIFGEISKNYGITELFYFSEWFFATELIHGNEDEENATELFERFEKCKDNQKVSLNNMKHNEYYEEILK